MCRNSKKKQKSHYLFIYKKLLFYPPYIKKRLLNGEMSFFICSNSIEVQKAQYLISSKKLFFLNHIVEKGFQVVKIQFSIVKFCKSLTT